MAGVADTAAEVPGYAVPVHRALTEHILLGGAPRGLAILNGTLAAALASAYASSPIAIVAEYFVSSSVSYKVSST